MRTGIFGGVFDPVHLGHLALARYAFEEARLDRVFFILTGTPPHKAGAVASGEHRKAMVHLAIGEEHRFSLSELELTHSPAYTYETVACFTARYPEDELFYLCGIDSLLQLPTWRNHKSILANAIPLAVPRPGFTEHLSEVAPHILARACILYGMAPVDLSSTTIRRMLTAGDPAASAFLPPAVADYIVRHNLYKLCR